MKKSNSTTSVKMVMVAGLLVREDQVEGRRRALAYFSRNSSRMTREEKTRGSQTKASHL